MDTTIGVGVMLAIGIAGYWLAHWLLTRPGRQGFGLIRKWQPMDRSNECGQTSMAGVGGYGVEQLARVVNDCERGNCAGQIGAGLGFELNEEDRNRAWAKLSSGFARTVWGASPLITNGLANRPVDEVNSLELRAKWVYDLIKAVERFCEAVRRPGSGLRAFDPTIIWIAVSTGGHLALAMELARILKVEFKRAAFFGLTILSEKREQRQELIKALRLHAQTPVFRFFVITDNLLDRAKNDKAVAMFVACITQARWVSVLAEDAYNALHNLYDKADGLGVAVLRYWERKVAVYTTLLPPYDYFVMHQDVVQAIFDGITAIDNEAEKCVDLDTPHAGCRGLVIVNIALRYPFLGRLETEIRDRLRVAGWNDKHPDRCLIFSSLGEHLTRQSRWTTASVISVDMATEGIDGVAKLLGKAAAPSPEDNLALPLMESPATPSGNGSQPAVVIQ